MATYGKAISGNSYKDNGGTVVFGGNIDNKNVSNAPGLTLAGFARDTNGSLVLDNSIVDKAVSANALATQSSYQIVGQAGSVAIPAADTNARKSYHYSSGDRTARYMNPAGATGGWNYVTGAPIQGTPVSGDNSNFGSYTPDSRSFGEFTMMDAGKNPTNFDYPARTG